MAKTLLLFIQSKTIDTYVNAITYCVIHKDVQDIYFIGNKEPVGKDFESQEIIERIKNRLNDLAIQHSEYKKARDLLSVQITNRIIRAIFVRPQDQIPEIKKRFPSLEDLIVDITGTNKQVAVDVVSSYITGGVNHICHFELADKVYSSEWNRGKLYHDVHGDVQYYEYIDFSEPGATIESINRLRTFGDDQIKVLKDNSTEKWARDLAILIGSALFGAFIPGFISELSAGRSLFVSIYTVLGIIGMIVAFWGLRK